MDHTKEPVNLCEGCSKWPCGVHSPIGISGSITTECSNRTPTAGAELSSLRSVLAEKMAQIEAHRYALGQVTIKRDEALRQVERLREALTNIHDYGIDRDGETTSEKLGELVDELVQLARKALAATAPKEE